MKRICIQCGKEAKVDNFCGECFLKKNKLFEIKDFLMVVCDNNDYYYISQWKELPSVNLMLKDAIQKYMKKLGDIDKTLIHFKPFKNGYRVSIRCIGSIKGIKKDQTDEIQVSIKNKHCPICVKLSGSYYEAKIQIRGDKSEEILQKAAKLAPKSCWIERNKYGADIFFVNKSDAPEIARYLRKRYEVKKSFKVMGSKKGKMIFRDFYSIK